MMTQFFDMVLMQFIQEAKKMCERPKSEWLIFEHTHEALVDQETWDIVQEVRSYKRRRTKMDEQNMVFRIMAVLKIENASHRRCF